MKKLTLFLTFLLLSACSSGQLSKINVYTRDSSSGTREAFEKGLDIAGSLTLSAIEASSNGDMMNKIASDSNGIGYISYIEDLSEFHVKALNFDGVEASVDSILDGSYKLQRPFIYITRASGDFDSEEKEQIITAFLDYLQNSTEGLLIVSHAGGIVDISKGVPWSELTLKYPILQQDNSHITIVTAGSTSVEKTIKAALQSFQPYAGDVNFVMNQTGSGDGFKRVIGSEKDGANKADIGFASRSLKVEENVISAMLEGTYCIDAISIIVNETNVWVDNLTTIQLKDIFIGESIAWQ